SSWSRAILVPLSIIYAFQPQRTPPPGVSVQPLFLEDKRKSAASVPLSNLVTWRNFFHATDRILRTMEQRRWTPLRRMALKSAEQWLLQHTEGSDGLGAIYPGMMNSVIALDCLGYSREDPVLAG